MGGLGLLIGLGGRSVAVVAGTTCDGDGVADG